MTAWKVDRKVGNVKNDTPDLIELSSAPETADERSPESPGWLFGS
jgi:hypothetical protein